jgi:HTH-type transcriptional regulator / antitoxin HigA
MNERKIAEAFPVGEFIKEELEARNWTQTELAEIIGRQPSVISDLISGKRSISPELAKAFGRAFNTDAEYWMNLDTIYQLWRMQDNDDVISRRARLYQIAPIKEITKRHWIEASENIDVLEERVMEFFNISNLDEPIDLPFAARKKTDDILPSHKAWFCRAKQIARAVDARAFSDQSFRGALAKLKNLLHSTVEIRHIPKILAEAGIRLVVIEQLVPSGIDGVTLWLDEKSPVIALSLRLDRVDGFWFTLAHELGHVKRRDGLRRKPILDIDIVAEEYEKLEKHEVEEEVNLFARDFLVTQSDLENFILRIRPLFGKQKIINFAKTMGVHPGIIIGQLQFRGEIHWSVHRKLLEKVRHIITQSALTDGWGQILPIFNDNEAA